MSKRIWVRSFLSFLVVLLPSTGALAEARLTWPLYGTEDDCARPSITGSSPATFLCLSSVTAWEEAGAVRSAYEGIACTGGARGDRLHHYDHGPGRQPTVGTLLYETYILAFVSGDSLVVREGDGETTWSTVATDYLGPSSNVLGRIDLWCSPYAGFEDLAWLAFWSDVDPEGAIRFMRRDASGWSPLETVPGIPSEPYMFTWPQVTEFGGPTSPQPRLYFNGMDPEPGLMVTDWLFGGGWTDPVSAQAGFEFGGEFDVASTAAGYVFLHTGLQPTCPCNVIHFSEWTWGLGWHPSISMTVHVDHYDWPMSPHIGMDWLGRVHAFWFQLGSDPSMASRTRRLYYQVREGGLWSDLSGDLAEQQDTGLESLVSMGMDGCGEAVFAWARRDTIEGVPQDQQVWQSYYNYCALDVGEAPPDPLRVTAAPNPFNPAVTLAATGRGAVVVAEIYDPRGRLVASLAPWGDAGTWRARWDGRDAAGREMPSGAYLARVRDAAGAMASCKLTLSR